MEELIQKYKNQLSKMIVMDDYDGGQKAMLISVIEDLEKRQKQKDLPDQQEVGVDY